MVIENVGNQPEHNLNIHVVLTLDNGTAVPALKDPFIDLAPGATRAITLQPLVTDSGMVGRLTVSVDPVSAETDVANNTITARVQFR
jgi:hypothetical protein